MGQEGGCGQGAEALSAVFWVAWPPGSRGSQTSPREPASDNQSGGRRAPAMNHSGWQRAGRPRGARVELAQGDLRLVPPPRGTQEPWGPRSQAHAFPVRAPLPFPALLLGLPVGSPLPASARPGPRLCLTEPTFPTPPAPSPSLAASGGGLYVLIPKKVSGAQGPQDRRESGLSGQGAPENRPAALPAGCGVTAPFLAGVRAPCPAETVL